MAAGESRPADSRAREAAEKAAASGGFLSDAGAMWRELQGVAHDYLVLITLETKRAGLSLAIIVAAGVGIALLMMTAWLGLWTAGALALIQFGLPPSLAVLVVVVANLLMAGGLYVLIRRRQRDLAFPATVRNLRPAAHSAGQAEQL